MDDLRIAIDELCYLLIQRGGDQPLQLEFAVDAGRFAAAGARATPSSGPPELAPLAARMLAEAIGGVELWREGGVDRFRITLGHGGDAEDSGTGRGRPGGPPAPEPAAS